jgi:hypothetical protein
MTMPARIARLDRDPRGYPIPWNVLRADDGTPFFTVNDDRRAFVALREGLCPICGERLGQWIWFVGGPQSAFHPDGYYFDLPGHRECMEYALVTCPYLAMPKYLGRVDVVHPELLPREARVLLDETQMPERPEIFVAVCCRRIRALDRGELQPYLKPAALMDWTFWRHGQQIPTHRAMPILRGIFGADWELPRRAA